MGACWSCEEPELRRVSASEWMLQRRLAVPYDGGKKKVWAGK